jgi:hypothetical protein
MLPLATESTRFKPFYGGHRAHRLSITKSPVIMHECPVLPYAEYRGFVHDHRRGGGNMVTGSARFGTLPARWADCRDGMTWTRALADSALITRILVSLQQYQNAVDHGAVGRVHLLITAVRNKPAGPYEVTTQGGAVDPLRSKRTEQAAFWPSNRLRTGVIYDWTGQRLP